MKQVGVGLLDGVDLHGKWPRGGGGNAVTFDHYMAEVPLLDGKCDKSWRERLAGLRNVTVSLGRPDFMLMNNEFGLGKADTYRGSWSRYQKGLAAIEFNMELHISGFDVACMWDNGAGPHCTLCRYLRKRNCGREAGLCCRGCKGSRTTAHFQNCPPQTHTPRTTHHHHASIYSIPHY